MNILLITPVTPFDTSFGSTQRTNLLYRALSEFGSVDVLILAESDNFRVNLSEHPKEIARVNFCSPYPLKKYTPDLEVSRWIIKNLDIQVYDLVVGRYLTPVTKVASVIHAPIIVDADDAYYRYVPEIKTIGFNEPTLLATSKSWVKTTLRTLLSYQALKRFEHIWFTTRRDQQFFSVQSSSLLPNIAPSFAAEFPTPQDQKMPLILFVGALWYGPNQDAINYFLNHCWSAIRSSIPEVRLRLVGACSLVQRNRWEENPGVECPGFVENLADEYRQASFTIAPIRYGGGTQIKVLESIAYGRTAIVSSFVLSGFSDAFFPDQSIIVADDPKLIIEQCLDLLHHPKRAAKIAEAGKEILVKNFSWPIFRTAVANTLDQVLRIPTHR